MRNKGGGRQAGGGHGNEPLSFIRGSGKKNLARVNPLGVAPDRNKRENRMLGRETLRKFMLSKHKDTLLDLSKLSKAPELSDLPCNLNSKAFMNMVIDIIAEDFPPIESLSLAGNNLTTLEHFKTCVDEHKMQGFIRNLDLSDNRIHSFKEVEHLKPFKLSEILMKGNPIAANQKEYSKHLLTRLPSVEMIDRVNVTGLRSTIKPKLPGIHAPFFFGEGTQELAFNFCQRFFKALDAGAFEGELLDAYTPDAMFTLTVSRNLAIGYGTRAEKIAKRLKESSHNLCAISNERAPAKAVAKGRLECVNSMKTGVYGEMRTTHDLTQFNVDAFPIHVTEPLVMVTVHGSCEFAVSVGTGGGKECKFKRCFDRTFVLKAAPQNSAWPAVIVNELLHLRPFRDTSVLTPEADTTRPPDLELARQTAMTKYMSSNTGLTVQYATLCLEAANWDPAQADALFKERKDQLPPEAWRNNSQ